MHGEGAKVDRRSGHVFGRSLRQFWGVMQEMSRMLDTVHGAEAKPGHRVADIAHYWEPRLTDTPAEGDIVMYFELPGVEREDLDLALHGNTLVVSGVRKDLPSLDNVTVEDFVSGDLELGPVSYSLFKGSVQVPSFVDEEDVEAAFGADLLQVRLVGAAENRSRRIHIRGGKRSRG